MPLMSAQRQRQVDLWVQDSQVYMFLMGVGGRKRSITTKWQDWPHAPGGEKRNITTKWQDVHCFWDWVPSSSGHHKLTTTTQLKAVTFKFWASCPYFLSAEKSSLCHAGYKNPGWWGFKRKSWRNGLTVESSCCSCRGARFSSQSPTYNSSSRGCDALFCSL